MTSKYMVTIAAAAFVASSGTASERRVQMKDLPAAVQETVREQTKGGKLVELAEETENGQKFYEAETEVDGRTRDILINAEGTVVEVEEEVLLESIPEPARSAIEREAGTGKIGKVEAVTKDGTTLYEAKIKKDGKKHEIKVTSDGTIQKE